MTGLNIQSDRTQRLEQRTQKKNVDHIGAKHEFQI